MIRGSAWILFILLNLLFISLSLRVVVTMTIKALKDNWAKYRCNPLAIPFSDNPTSDFTFCVQKMQGSYMKYLLQPLNSMFDNLGQLSGMFGNNIFDIFAYVCFILYFISKKVSCRYLIKFKFIYNILCLCAFSCSWWSKYNYIHLVLSSKFCFLNQLFIL